MITIKSEREIELMREAGKMVSMTHQYLKNFIKPIDFVGYQVYNINRTKSVVFTASLYSALNGI